MSRTGITVQQILSAAVQITEEKGFEAVSLKEISRQLGVSSPSLYNHIDGLPQLKDMVSHFAMTQLKEKVVRAALGRSGIDALREMGWAYIRYARDHPGLYETIQWMNIAADNDAGSLFNEVVQLVYDIGAQTGMDELEASHIIRTIRSLAHGFASIESHQGFAHESSVESSYEYAVEMFMAGVRANRTNTDKK